MVIDIEQIREKFSSTCKKPCRCSKSKEYRYLGYYAEKENAQSNRDRWEKDYEIVFEVFEVPNAEIWKYWVGTQTSFEHELYLKDRKKK